MKKALFLFFSVLLAAGCGAQQHTIINPEGQTLQQRFAPPEGYARTPLDSASFGHYLRTLPLKPHGAKVKYYDGKAKPASGVYIAVVDMEILPKNLEQCADAVMRLYGEYRFARQEYGKIKFNYVSDGKPRYFKDYAKGDYSYKNFLKYMEQVFMYANTASLRGQLTPVKKFAEMQPGDVFVQKGTPYGHAVIVADMAQDKDGNKVYLLAQSYMPAQQTQVLINPQNTEISPWYELKEGPVYTPEWEFTPQDLRRF